DAFAACAADERWIAITQHARVVEERAVTGLVPSELAHESWLRAAFGVAAEDAVAAHSAPVDGSPAPCWRVDPVHLHVGRDHLVLTDPAALSLEPEQSQALAAEVAPLFEGDALALHASSPGRWYLREIDPDRTLRLE